MEIPKCFPIVGKILSLLPDDGEGEGETGIGVLTNGRVVTRNRADFSGIV